LDYQAILPFRPRVLKLPAGWFLPKKTACNTACLFGGACNSDHFNVCLNSRLRFRARRETASGEGRPEKMRRLMILGILLGLAGCQSMIGPFAPRQPKRVDDPRLPISEQEKWGRDRWALPDDASKVAPPSGTLLPR
jgi:hypothetical protein